MANPTRDRVPIEPQSVDAPLSSAAVFLVMTIAPGDEALARVRSVISDIGVLVRAVGFRDLTAISRATSASAARPGTGSD